MRSDRSPDRTPNSSTILTAPQRPPRFHEGGAWRTFLARGWTWFAGVWGIAIPLTLLLLGALWIAWASQAPPPDDPTYGLWVARARLRFGPLFDPLDRLGLWSLSETPGWRLLWAALGWGLLVHALEAARARRSLGALSAALLLAALLVGALGRYLPPPHATVLAPGEAERLEGFQLSLEEDHLSLWRQGDLIGRTAFREFLPFSLGPYAGFAGRSHFVWELEAAGPAGPLTLRASWDAPPVSRLLLHPSPEGEAFAAIPDARWILRLQNGRALTVFEEGTGAVIRQEELPAPAAGQSIERQLPGDVRLRFTARPVYRVRLFPLPVFLQRALGLGLAALGLALGGVAFLREALSKRRERRAFGLAHDSSG